MTKCKLGPPPNDQIAWLTALTTYLGYAVLIIFGYLRDFIDHWFRGGVHVVDDPEYAPIVKDFEDFYTRRMYTRIRDAFNRPVCSTPDAYIEVMEQRNNEFDDTNTLNGRTRRCLNLGSYNYLGFGGTSSPCLDSVMRTFDNFPVSTCSSRLSSGTTVLHIELEKMVARFVGKPAALVFGMGYGTNSTVLPALVQKGDLIISDSLNHTSIIVGARLSKAKIKTFPHGDVRALESIIRDSIAKGQSRTHRPWNKILVIIEGIYSMEGEICRLPDILAVTQQYKCYVYLDEAHSIGAIGATGRGVCEYTGVNPNDVDILMGTFTKSFGAVGGYIAASEDVINYLRIASPGISTSPGLPPACCQQVISSMQIITGEDGTNIGAHKLKTLRENSNFFRRALMNMGTHVLGDWDSPVIPMMICNPAKISAFSRECLKRNLAVVVVGFPATPLLLSRVRFCISAAHTRQDLEKAVAIIDEVCSIVHVKYMKKLTG